MASDAYKQAVAAIRTQVREVARRLFLANGSWRDADLEQFVERFVPLMLAAETRIALLTSRDIERELTELFGTARPISIDTAAVTGSALRNADPNEVYARAYHEVWYRLAEGDELNLAVRKATERLDKMVLSDLQLAKTHTYREALQQDGRAPAFERVLTGAENCSLCVVASTQRYHRSNLLPIHPGCDCDVRPLAVDTGEQIINHDRLNEVEAQLFEDFGETPSSEKNLLRNIMVRDHPEIGPYLQQRGHSFKRL